MKNHRLLRNEFQRLVLPKGLTHLNTRSILGAIRQTSLQVEPPPSDPVEILQKIANFSPLQGQKSMWDTCAVELRVTLPKNVADEVAEVQRKDPEMLSRMVYYAMTRRTIYDHLSTHTRPGFSEPNP